MTTTTYTVAYPHPGVPSEERIKLFRPASGAGGDTLIELLCDHYPDHRDDLKGATLWKASRSTVVQLPPDQHHRLLNLFLRSWIMNPKCQYTSGSEEERDKTRSNPTIFWKTAFPMVRDEGLSTLWLSPERVRIGTRTVVDLINGLLYSHRRPGPPRRCRRKSPTYEGQVSLPFHPLCILTLYRAARVFPDSRRDHFPI